MAMKPWKKKLVLVGVVLGLAAIPFAWWGARYLYYHGVESKAHTRGVLRKVALVGHPGCHYLRAELVVQGTQTLNGNQIWVYTVDDSSDANPLVQKLKAAQDSGKPINVEYRRDQDNKDKLWVCDGQPEYYITSVD